MDDIRRPQRPQRRDFSLPQHRPPIHQPYSPPKPSAVSRPANDYSAPQPAPVPPQPGHHHHYPPPSTQHQYAAHHQAQHHTPPHHTKKGQLPKPLIAIVIIFVATCLFAAGFFFKSEPNDTIPDKIVKQVDYNLYFPSPMPAGYTYMKDTATFQIGQVFYKFSNGKKRVTVKEEPLPTPKPNLDLLSGYLQFDSPVGKAALGSTFGQPTAVILSNTTVITMNTVGGVTSDDLRTAINNLRDIGRNPKNG